MAKSVDSGARLSGFITHLLPLLNRRQANQFHLASVCLSVKRGYGGKRVYLVGCL